jgi:hypothetical protein
VKNDFYMKALVLLLLFSPLAISAQTPGFKFGPRIGFGVSKFTGLDNAHAENAAALQIGLTARKQLTSYFSIEFCPLVGTYGSRARGIEQDGVDSLGNPIIYTCHDEFRVGVVEFPVLAKFSVGIHHVYINAFFGPSICVNMFGMHSKRYDDERYNFDHGFTGYSIRELYDGCYSGVAGIGIEKETKKGILGFDMRLHQSLTPMGKIENSKFYIGTLTVGITWLQ